MAEKKPTNKGSGCGCMALVISAVVFVLWFQGYDHDLALHYAFHKAFPKATEEYFPHPGTMWSNRWEYLPYIVGVWVLYLWYMSELSKKNEAGAVFNAIFGWFRKAIRSSGTRLGVIDPHTKLRRMTPNEWLALSYQERLQTVRVYLSKEHSLDADGLGLAVIMLEEATEDLMQKYVEKGIGNKPGTVDLGMGFSIGGVNQQAIQFSNDDFMAAMKRYHEKSGR